MASVTAKTLQEFVKQYGEEDVVGMLTSVERARATAKRARDKSKAAHAEFEAWKKRQGR